MPFNWPTWFLSLFCLQVIYDFIQPDSFPISFLILHFIRHLSIHFFLLLRLLPPPPLPKLPSLAVAFQHSTGASFMLAGRGVDALQVSATRIFFRSRLCSCRQSPFSVWRPPCVSVCVCERVVTCACLLAWPPGPYLFSEIVFLTNTTQIDRITILTIENWI